MVRPRLQETEWDCESGSQGASQRLLAGLLGFVLCRYIIYYSLACSHSIFLGYYKSCGSIVHVYYM